MDNEAVFAADANVDTRLRMSRAREDRADRYPHAAVEGEDAPLLPDREDEAETASIIGGAAGNGGANWTGSVEFDGQPWWKRPSIFWILPPFLLFTLSFGGIIVPKIDLILTLVCRQYFADMAVQNPSLHVTPAAVFGENNPQCNIPEVQSLVARFTLYCNLASGILSAVTSPKLGALSDRYGRRKIIVLSVLGMFCSEIVTIICATNPDKVSVYWLLVGYVFDGTCGSFIAAMALAHSYATDCTAPEKRGMVFGYFHGCLFVGIAAGPIIAGHIVKATGQILVVFYIGIANFFLLMMVFLFVVPESLSPQRQAVAREKHRISVLDTAETDMQSADGTMFKSRRWMKAIRRANLLAPLSILYPTGEGSSNQVRRNLLLLAAVDTITFGVAMGSMTVVIIYSKYMFGWDTAAMATFMSVVNFGRVGMLLIALPLITRVFRRRQKNAVQKNTGSDQLDLVLIRLAIFFDALGYLGYTLARTGPLFILSGVVTSVGGIGSPTIQSSLTKHVPPDRTGQLLGATGLLHALARVISPTIFNMIYSLTVGKFTQTTFVCLTAAFGSAFVVSLFIKPHVYLDEPEPDVNPTSSRSREESENIGSL